MLEAHNVAAVRAAEAQIAAEVGWDALMQKAATGLAQIVAERVPAHETILMLVGPGNNGGDALFAAAILCEQGRRVNLLILDDARVHRPALDAATAAGAGRVESPEGHRWCVEALFGIGARPGLPDRARPWADWIAAESPFVIAVDTPVVPSDITVTMGTYKPDLLVGPTADLAGEIVLVDIGLDTHLDDADMAAIESSDGERLSLGLFAPTTDKYARGVVGIAAGSDEYPGAAHLAVAGAQAGPAGMVRYRGPADLVARVVDRAPEVVLADGRVQAWVVGPGGGPDSGDVLRAALADSVPTVVDASALEFLPARLDPQAVLTPHAGELAKLLDVERSAVEADPLAHARAASERWNATVLLKGKHTLVVSPGEPVWVNRSGTPWLATAGSGDVLAGFIGSLLATGQEPVGAAAMGAFLHGAAAVAANRGGPVTASDVAAALPRVTAQFLAGTLGEVRDW